MKKYKILILILGAVLVSLAGYRALAKPIGSIGKGIFPSISTDALSSPESTQEAAKDALERKVAAGFARLDKDQDRKISYDEFMAPHRKRFKEDDTNKDGFLTKEEFRNALTKYMKKRMQR